MTKVEYAVQWCEMIAADNTHGYDWTHQEATRWGPDYDCSSLIITAYEKAGIPVKSVGGAGRTWDMKAAFLKCGFIEVPNWNRNNGVGLIRGDVVLNYADHTEIVVGPQQLLKASSDYDGRQGDSGGNEIRVGGYYNFPWNCALRYRNQNEQYTGQPLSSPTAYDYALSGEIASVEPDYTEIKSYITSVNRDTKSTVDYKALKDIGLIGTMIEAGYLYNLSHIKVDTYRSPKLDEQVTAAKKAEVLYGLYGIVRAKNVEEAREELAWLRIYIQKYVPPLGVWLKLELSAGTAMNDMIVSAYYDMLKSAGLVGKVGFYVTRDQLSKITWSKWQEQFLLWLIDPISDISEIEQILTPEFFMLEKS